VESILNPHLAWLWVLVLKRCSDNECPIWLFHALVIALVVAATAVILLLARELWFLRQILRRQF
jgi:hypothetical protein